MSRWWAAALVAALTLVVHARAKSGDFLWYDDQRFVVDNPHLDDLGNAGRFFVDLETTAAPQKATRDIYRPLRTLTYAVIANVWDRDDAGPYHVASILCHVAAAVVLLLVLREGGLGPWGAAVGALAWALHPLTVEVTAWVCSLGDAACGLFSLLAILAWARGRWVLAALALVTALFWKEHAVVVPGIWLAWDWCHRRDEVGGARLLKGPALGLALAIGFLVFRSMVVGANLSQVPEPYGVATMLAGLGWYAATTLFPYGPTFDAHVEPQDSLLAAPALAGLAVLALLAWAVARGPRRVRFGAAWFLLALVPVSNVFVTLKIPTADRFLYLPLMGLAVLAGELAERTRPRSVLLGPVALLVLALLTIVRIGDWSGDEKLIEAGLRVHPKSRMLLWAEASRDAQRALEDLRAGDAGTAFALGDRAERNYERYLNNSAPEERTQVFLELGRLKYAFGVWLQENDPQERHLVMLRAAFDMYAEAFKLQVTGTGRVVDAEVREAAERLRELGMLLARPSERAHVGRTIDITRRVLQFLKQEHGRDDRYDQARLVLAESIVIRAENPAKARAGFEAVLKMADELDPKYELGGTLYLRGQALLYLGVLEGRYNVEQLEAAYDHYMRAARFPGLDVAALLGAAKATVFLAKRSDDPALRQRALALLANLKRRRLPLSQQREVDALLRTVQ